MAIKLRDLSQILLRINRSRKRVSVSKQLPPNKLPNHTSLRERNKSSLQNAVNNSSPQGTALIDAFSNLSITKDAKPSESRARQPKRHFSTDSNGKKGSKNSDSNKYNLENIARLITSGRAKNIIVMAGAGISTGSGIPDFRTPGTGLYDNLQKYRIPSPTAIFDMEYFHYDPKPFFTLAKELYPDGKYRPCTPHHFVKFLHDKGLLLRMYTQNIDGLERIAGIPSEKLVEAHGTFSTASCTKCGKKHNGQDIKIKVMNGIIPRCQSSGLCWGIVKPDIVFFGEDLPRRFYYYLKDFPQCDLLIIMGTSLEVEPFASLTTSVRLNTPRLLLNKTLVGPFKSRSQRRAFDVGVTGDFTDTFNRFLTFLGWKDEFNNMVELAKLEEVSEKKMKNLILALTTVEFHYPMDQITQIARKENLFRHLIPILRDIFIRYVLLLYQNLTQHFFLPLVMCHIIVISKTSLLV
uniref:NAD-dependent protein deacetylase sirtuin-3-like isoform X2 n=1 Tax=Styela clava TaxID=7725 RepID=UPI00193A5362|nr:NAD-dependent protein deacetylase sirtuin-3-like isoform X2 [Styela clava]